MLDCIWNPPQTLTCLGYIWYARASTNAPVHVSMYTPRVFGPTVQATLCTIAPPPLAPLITTPFTTQPQFTSPITTAHSTNRSATTNTSDAHLSYLPPWKETSLHTNTPTHSSLCARERLQKEIRTHSTHVAIISSQSHSRPSCDARVCEFQRLAWLKPNSLRLSPNHTACIQYTDISGHAGVPFGRVKSSLILRNLYAIWMWFRSRERARSNRADHSSVRYQHPYRTIMAITHVANMTCAISQSTDVAVCLDTVLVAAEHMFLIIKVAGVSRR
jgi:hypothetical protein